MFRHVHGEGGFTHAWPSGNDNHLGGVQSAGESIQFDETSREPGNSTTPLPKFFDAFWNDVLRRNQHRTEHPLLGFDAMRWRAVNILCRTCGRALKNSPATLLRQASVSAISRCLTRLLRTTSLRARHLFASSE